MPSGRKTLVFWLVLRSMAVATGLVMTAPKPKPPTAMPVMSPRLSGNHFTSIAIGVMYARPSPMPPMTP